MNKKESIRRKLRQLDLPAIAMSIFDGVKHGSYLSYRCSEPFHSLVSKSGLPEHLLPIWECGTTVSAYDESDGTYCKVDLEAPSEAIFRVPHFEGLVSDVLIDLWEDEIPDEDLAGIANRFEYDRLPELVATLENGPVGDYGSWRATIRKNNSEPGGRGNAG